VKTQRTFKRSARKPRTWALVVVSHRPGRLGNMLYMYINLMAISLHYGFTLLNPAFTPYANYFEGLNRLPQTSQGSQPRKPRLLNLQLMQFSELVYRFFNYIFRVQLKFECLNNLLIKSVLIDSDKELEIENPVALQKILSTPICLFGGWLLYSDSLVEMYKNVLKPIFTPNTSITNKAKLLIKSAKKTANKKYCVGVHIRRTDYKFFKGGAYFYSNNTYKKYMELISKELKGNVSFIIFSDERIAEDAFNPIPAKMSNNAEIIDMYAMSLCDGIIGPPSTFSGFSTSFWGSNNIFFIEEENAEIPQKFFEKITR